MFFLLFAGEKCKVQDPKSGYEYNLTPLSGKDYEVKGLGYEYHFAVCSPITSSVCPHGPSNTVSSCQVDGQTHRIAGEFISLVQDQCWASRWLVVVYFLMFNMFNPPLQG